MNKSLNSGDAAPEGAAETRNSVLGIDGRNKIQYPFSDAEESTDELGPARRQGERVGNEEADYSPRLRPTEDAEDSEGVEPVQLGEAEKTMKNEQVIMSGYLYKKGEKRRTWKNRWFVLRPSRLAYYHSEKEYELLKIIDLHDIHAIAEVELKKRSNVFGIVTRGRTFYVQAETTESMQDWMRAIGSAHHRITSTADSNTSGQERLSSTRRSSHAQSGGLSPTNGPPAPQRRTSNNQIPSTKEGDVGSPPTDTVEPIHTKAGAAASSANTESTQQAAGPLSNEDSGHQAVSNIQSHGKPQSSDSLQRAHRDTSSQTSNPESVQTADSFQTNTTTPSSVFTDLAHSSIGTPETILHAHSSASFGAPGAQPLRSVPGRLGNGSAPTMGITHTPPLLLDTSTTCATAPHHPNVSFAVDRSSRANSAASTPAYANPQGDNTSSSDDEDGQRTQEELEAAGIGGGPMNDNKVIVQGYLEKRVSNNYKKLATHKKWKKRWFVLRNGRLFGYKNDGEYVVKRLIPLRSVVDVLEIDPQGKHHLHCFKIVLPKRQLVLCASSESELRTWIEGLQAVHAALRKAQVHTPTASMTQQQHAHVQVQVEQVQSTA